MEHDRPRWRGILVGLASLSVTIVLAGAVLTLAACAGSSEETDDPALAQATQPEEEAAGQEVEESSGQEAPTSIEDLATEGIGSSVDELAGPESEAADEEGSTSFDSWAPECLDQNGDVTLYAVSELKGWQLETLLQQQEYSWSTRNQLWVNANSSVAVVVRGADGEELTDDKISELDQGAGEGSASYRIVTSRYSTPQKAFDALVGKVMVCEDSEFAETSGVAVVYGPSKRRSLVFVSTSNEVVYLSFYGEDAVKAGFFNDEAGSKLGSSVAETFQTLTGRIPGADH